MPRVARKQTESDTVFDSLRAGTNYERMTGYAPFFRAWLADLPRLCPGLSCRTLIDAITLESLGRPRDKGEPMPEWTPDMDKGWLATVCRTDKRSVDRDLKYLETSGMAQVRHVIRGGVAVRLMFRDWPNLPDYRSPERPQPSGEPSAPQETVELVKAPRRVKAGERSDPVKVSCPVSSLRCGAGGSVDLAFTAVVKAGELLIVTEGLIGEQKAKGEEQANQDSRVNVFNKKVQKPTTGVSINAQKCEEKAKGEVKAKHPRADELARLLDPILLRSCHRSLSTDPVIFTEVLNALGDVPHDFLVKFVIQRAERPISSPRICLSIIRDVVQSWHETKDLPPAMPVQRSRRMTPTEQAIELAKQRRREKQA